LADAILKANDVAAAVSPDELLAKIPEAVVRAAELAGLGLSVSTAGTGEPKRLYVSDTAARILGYPKDELLGSSTMAIFAPEATERMTDVRRRFLASGEPLPWAFESVVLTKDGSRRPIEIAYSIVELDGEPLSVSLLRDITERRQAEEALKKSEGLFRKLIEAAPGSMPTRAIWSSSATTRSRRLRTSTSSTSCTRTSDRAPTSAARMWSALLSGRHASPGSFVCSVKTGASSPPTARRCRSTSKVRLPS
jgi:PAS domain S-box-containing protein